MNKNYNYKRLTPFKWFVLQNFPFIDEDFDAITNYQLFCKLGEEINKIILSMNQAGVQVEELTDFVNNYFDNLNVQDEIDYKLDQMAQDGTLANIINQEIFSNINNEINNIKNTLKTPLKDRKFLFIGDSYGINGSSNGINWTSWIDTTIQKLGLTLNDNAFKIARGGYGFIGDNSSPKPFIDLLNEIESSILNKNDITDIIICGGVNDYNNPIGQVTLAIQNFMNRAKTLFPNAIVSLGFISYTKSLTYLSQFPRLIMEYQSISNNGGVYITGSETCCHYTGWIIDAVHPNNDGMSLIVNCIINYILGKVSTNKVSAGNNATIIKNDNFNIDNSQTSMITRLLGNVVSIELKLGLTSVNPQGFEFNFTNNDTWYELCSYSNAWLCGSGKQILMGQILINDLNDNSTKSFICFFKFENNKIFIKCHTRPSSNIKGNIILVPSQSFVIPAIGN